MSPCPFPTTITITPRAPPCWLDTQQMSHWLDTLRTCHAGWILNAHVMLAGYSMHTFCWLNTQCIYLAGDTCNAHVLQAAYSMHTSCLHHYKFFLTYISFVSKMSEIIYALLFSESINPLDWTLEI